MLSYPPTPIKWDSCLTWWVFIPVENVICIKMWELLQKDQWVLKWMWWERSNRLHTLLHITPLLLLTCRSALVGSRLWIVPQRNYILGWVSMSRTSKTALRVIAFFSIFRMSLIVINPNSGFVELTPFLNIGEDLTRLGRFPKMKHSEF